VLLLVDQASPLTAPVTASTPQAALVTSQGTLDVTSLTPAAPASTVTSPSDELVHCHW